MSNRQELFALKRSVGRKPFESRLKLSGDYSACPFHAGDGNKSMHLVEKDGVWLATCFSSCQQKSWDVISFVMDFDKVDFKEALNRLRGGSGSMPTEASRPKSKPMTEQEWNQWGRDLTAADIERLAKSRKDKTANFETFKALGCRVKGDHIGFPYRYAKDGEVQFDAIRLRHLDTKEFSVERAVSLQGLFNLDTVFEFEDVYVLEGEPDVAVMEEAGFRAVSVTTGAQKKFESHAIETLKRAPRIFLIGDQSTSGEDPGQKCMDALQKLLPPEKTFRVNFTEAKDVSELARQLGDAFTVRIEELRDDSLTPWIMRDENVPSISQLSSEPVKWLVDDMFPYGGLSIYCGKQGGMKSLFALFLAKAVASASDPGITWEDEKLHRTDSSTFLGRRIPHNVPVLYIDRENPEGMVSDRARAMGIIANRRLRYWGDWSSQTPEIDDPRLMEFARREKGFIIFDSLQDWYGDASEIDNTAMVALMGKFRRLARAGAGVLVLHHQAKYRQGVFRGGTAIVALTDMAFNANKSERDVNVIELRAERFRMCAEWEIDFQVHWNAGEQHHNQKFYQFEVLRDEAASHAAREREQESAE